MAEYKITHDETHQVTLIVVDGAVAAEELKVIMQSREYQDRKRLALYDLRNSTFSNISTERLIAMARALKPQLRPGACAAFAVRTGVDIGLTNIFKVYSEQLHYDIQLEIFTDYEKAWRWLTTGQQPST